MDFNSLTDSGADTSLPSLMYIDYNQPPTIQLPPPTTMATLPSISLQPPQSVNINIPKKRPNKVHVSAACVNCKKAHLACDISRPCNRCIATDKADTCKDIQHKKRGRPKMQRDENNNKIRPSTTSSTSPSILSKNKSHSPNTTSSDDMLTIFLSMDLCCARVSDKSLEYLELYPQEFSQRSMYDFLIPGESRDLLSKLHRYLLDNAVQYQPTKSKLPSEMIRSSSEKFFSTPLEQLLTISNGSLTLKHQLRFYHGRQKESADKVQMDCKFYLGGGLGADVLNYADLDKLYIVCMVEPSEATEPQKESSNRIQLPPLILNDDTDDFLKDPIMLDDDNQSHSSSSSEISTNQSHSSSQQQSPHVSVSSISSNNSKKINVPSTTTSTPTSENQQVLLDKFKYQSKPASNQFIHPNELYYLKTTSSRLSSEAIAHTNFTYLSKSQSKNVIGSGPLAHYNSNLNK